MSYSGKKVTECCAKKSFLFHTLFDTPDKQGNFGWQQMWNFLPSLSFPFLDFFHTLKLCLVVVGVVVLTPEPRVNIARLHRLVPFTVGLFEETDHHVSLVRVWVLSPVGS